MKSKFFIFLSLFALQNFSVFSTEKEKGVQRETAPGIYNLSSAMEVVLAFSNPENTISCKEFLEFCQLFFKENAPSIGFLIDMPYENLWTLLTNAEKISKDFVTAMQTVFKDETEFIIIFQAREGLQYFYEVLNDLEHVSTKKIDLDTILLNMEHYLVRYQNTVSRVTGKTNYENLLQFIKKYIAIKQKGMSALQYTKFLSELSDIKKSIGEYLKKEDTKGGPGLFELPKLIKRLLKAFPPSK